jgi:hypothetical protein
MLTSHVNLTPKSGIMELYLYSPIRLQAVGKHNFTLPHIVFNTFSPAAFKTLKSTVPGHFTTLWKLRSTSTPSGQLARYAAEYYYSARAESVNTSNAYSISPTRFFQISLHAYDAKNREILNMALHNSGNSHFVKVERKNVADQTTFHRKRYFDSL